MTSDRESPGRTEAAPGARPDERLHLPSLSVQGLRGIEDLSIPRLGRVTLLAGRNGVGKTTVLDAVRIHASRARPAVLSALLVGRDEIAAGKDEDGGRMSLSDGRALFFGRDTSGDARIAIGPLDGPDQLQIRVASLSGEPDSLSKTLLGKLKGGDTRVMKISFRDSVQLLPPGPQMFPRELMQLLASEASELPPEVSCESLGPGLPGSGELARLWDRITLTDDEDRVIRAVNLAMDEAAERVAVVGDSGGHGGQGPNGRRVVVRIEDQSHPVPLKSLGDGAVRLLGVALALANSRDGFLLIDEAENGIHHAVQRDFWRMVLQTARDNNVQVLATTHGWDCVRGFAQAATELAAVEGVLVRLERRADRVRAIEYTEDELAVAARDGIEVR